MAVKNLQSTVTQQVRTFLAEAGLRQQPWASAGEVFQALTELLSSKKDDADFWHSMEAPLGSLMAALSSPRGSSGLGFRDMEILRDTEVAGLVQEIRAAVPGPGEGRLDALGFLCGMRATAATAFLALSLSLGCADDDSILCDQPSKVEQGSFEDYICESNLSRDEKGLLLTCLSKFTSNERADIVQMFEQNTPEEIADFLEDMASSSLCAPDGPDDDSYGSHALYKGISFPRR